MKYICIGYDTDTIAQIDGIAKISGRALSLWLRAMLLILDQNNKMPVVTLTRQLCGHNVPKTEVRRLLDLSNSFEYDASHEYISCTQATLQKFLPPANFLPPQAKILPPQAQNASASHARIIITHDNNKINNKISVGKKKKMDFATLSSQAPTPEAQAFYQMLLSHCPRVCAMEEPLTYEDYQKLLAEGIPIPKIRETLSDMENHKKLLTKYVSAIRTLRKWIKISEQ